MGVEGVMVSYNYSEDGELANILTVAASGIMFSNRWVLTHGSILSPLKEARAVRNAKGNAILNEEFYDKLPEIYVTCEKRASAAPSVYEELEKLSRERSLDHDPDFEQSCYQIRVLTGRICHVWQCPVLQRCADAVLFSWTVGHRGGDLEAQGEAGRALLSVFVLVDLESGNQGLKTLRPLSELFDMVQPSPERGSMIEVHSTPFGCEAFLNAATRGSICGVVGKRPSLLLTDASTALGSEGGPVFAEGGSALVGVVVCSVAWWRGEWVGLTLAAPLRAVLAAKLRVRAAPARPLPDSPFARVLDTIDRTAVLVRCGAAWGAGVFLGDGYFLTCAHVVRQHLSHKVVVQCVGARGAAAVRFAAAPDRAFDLALLSAEAAPWAHLAPALFARQLPEKGEAVLAAGFPYFSEAQVPALRPTVTGGRLTNVSPSMLHTSCCVQSGFSGGPVLRVGAAVQVAGVVVSNAKTQHGACYPFVNMAVPAAAFLPLIDAFLADKDETKLRAFESNKEMIQSQWRLLPYRSKI